MQLQPFLSSDLVHRLGWTLIHALWQGALVVALLWVALAMLRRRSAQARYLASTGAMALVVIGAIGTFYCLGAPVPAPAPATPPNHTSVAASTDAVDAGGSPASGRLRQDSTAVSADRPTRMAAPAQPQAKALRPTGSPAAVVPTPLGTSVAERLKPLMPWFILIWAAGVVLLSIWNLGGWIAAQRLKVLGTSPAGAEVAALVERLSRQFQLSRPVRVLQSLLADTPVVIGWLRPVILIPGSVLTGLSPAQLEAVLAHELAHVRRHDYLVNLFQIAVETLLFYHPAVWWISSRIRLEREQCCDDVALTVCNDRCVYAGSLAALEEVRLNRPLALAATGSGGAQLLLRVRRVLGLGDDQGPRGARGLAAIVVLLTTIAAAVLGGKTPLASNSRAAEQGEKGQPTTAPATQPSGTAPRFDQGIWNRPLQNFTRSQKPDAWFALMQSNPDVLFSEPLRMEDVWINPEKLGLPAEATIEEVARRTASGDLYVPDLEEIEPIRGTMMAPLAIPPDPKVVDQVAFVNGLRAMTCEAIADEVRAYHRQHPEAKSWHLQEGEHYAVLRADGALSAMGVHGKGKEMWVQLIPIGAVRADRVIPDLDHAEDVLGLSWHQLEGLGRIPWPRESAAFTINIAATATVEEKVAALAAAVEQKLGTKVHITRRTENRPCIVLDGEARCGLGMAESAPGVVAHHAVIVTSTPITDEQLKKWSADLLRWGRMGRPKGSGTYGDLDHGVSFLLGAPFINSASDHGQFRQNDYFFDLDDAILDRADPQYLPKLRQVLDNFKKQVGGDWRVESRDVETFSLQREPAAARPAGQPADKELVPTSASQPVTPVNATRGHQAGGDPAENGTRPKDTSDTHGGRLSSRDPTDSEARAEYTRLAELRKKLLEIRTEDHPQVKEVTRRMNLLSAAPPGATSQPAARDPAVQSQPTTGPTSTSLPSGSRLQFRLVAEANGNGVTEEMIDPNSRQPLRVLREAALDERDVARAYITKTQDGAQAVGIDFSDTGAKKFEALTTANVNHRLAIVLRGKLVSAPRIMTPMSMSTIIVAGRDGFGDVEATSLVEELNARPDRPSPPPRGEPADR